jgi:hypothetical protein
MHLRQDLEKSMKSQVDMLDEEEIANRGAENLVNAMMDEWQELTKKDYS